MVSMVLQCGRDIKYTFRAIKIIEHMRDSMKCTEITQFTHIVESYKTIPVTLAQMTSVLCHFIETELAVVTPF